jgi:hypothetical protein
MLGKLIPRLGSRYDGEVVATVRAIQRTLQGAGADLHDLCAAMGAPVLVAWREQVDFCLQHPETLTDREKEFLESMVRWRKPTEKQAAWLNKIHGRLYR